MPVKIRLQRKGRKKSPFYHIVIADSRSPRDGKFIENIGVYDPMTKPASIELDRDKAYDWLKKGAQPTETVRAILRFKGVLYKKHLMDGVTKGALTEEQALAKWNAWVEDKESRIKKRRDASDAEKEAFRQAVSGTVPKIVIKEEPAEEVLAEEPEAHEVEEEVTAEASVSEEAIAEENSEATAEDTSEATSAEEEKTNEEG